MFLDAPLLSKSGRIALVPPTEADDESIAALRSDPRVRRFLRFMPESVSTADMAARRLTQAADKTVLIFNIHALKLRPDGSLIRPHLVGQIWMHRMDKSWGSSCEVGITICPRYFRGTLAMDAVYTMLEYAFKELKFHRVVFRTAVDNIIIRSWIERAGGTFEGFERGRWADGKGGYEDVCLYSILDREWGGIIKKRMEKGGVGPPRSHL
ncbi:acyl-CoA N-acyltransferase [Mycena leptocephala]|nr:acyl-CoA N-acyltransferase [Mycena leptocephala]